MSSPRSCCFLFIVLVHLCLVLGALALRSDWRDFINKDLYNKHLGKTSQQFNRSYFQGDIDKVDCDASEQQAVMAFNAVKDAKFRWPDATVPFTISTSFSDGEQMLIRKAITAITESTNDCVRFLDRTTEVDYIQIIRGLSCYSTGIGRQGGAQHISFTIGCLEEYGDVQHEILHALGFYHEHTRLDRDKYVSINWRNIREDDQFQFQKFDGITFDLPYDYASVMHYPWNAFAMNLNLPTMVPNLKNAMIGQKASLSPTDIKRIRRAYGCDELNNTTDTGDTETATMTTTTTMTQMTTATTTEEETPESQPTTVTPPGQVDHFQGFSFAPAVTCVQTKGFYRNSQRARATALDLLINCRTFYQCVSGTVFQLNCPPSTYFNVISQQCEDDGTMTAHNCALDNRTEIATADRDWDRDRDDYGRDHNHGDEDHDEDSSYCKPSWVANELRNKCYFFYTSFNTYSTFETQAFCQQLGGKVTEPRNQKEYDDVLRFVKRQKGWTDGPLLNFFSPANDDTTVVQGSDFQAPRDSDLLQTLQALNKATTNGTPLLNQCFTFSPQLVPAFGPCNSTNNPFCEVPYKPKY